MASGGVLSALLDQLRLQQATEHYADADRRRSAEAWTPQHWHQAYTFLFLQQQHEVQLEDDLLWFVAAAGQQQQQLRAGQAEAGRVTLRRKAGPDLPAELQLGGAQFDRIDWGRSTLLNLVAHSSYQLTVVLCRQEALCEVAQGHLSRPGVHAVTHQVYASPYRTGVNIASGSNTKAHPAEQRLSYPDICFAVDDYEHCFEDVVLAGADDLYCILLHHVLPPASGTASAGHAANGPPASAPGPTRQPQQQQQQQHLRQQAVLFSAYVSHGQVVEYLARSTGGSGGPGQAAGGSGSLLSKLLGRPTAGAAAAAVQLRREAIVMAGPGGVGRAEVAAMRASGQHGASPRVQCALAWLSLPVGALAQAVLGGLCQHRL